MMHEEGDIIDGRYRVQAELGRGGMGAVYRVVDIETGDLYALKTCIEQEEEFRRRFIREATFMSRIDHENVISILAANLEYDPPYFLMPLAEGSLLDRIGNGMAEEHALEAVLQVCLGLRAIHSSNGTHRDIKPENLLCMSDSRVVVSDLGLIKVDPRETTVLTRTAVALGTMYYWAPEQLVPGGSREADARTDVYQVGKTLYHLLTGELPALIDPERLPRSLALIIQRATRENPSDRYQTIDQFADAINNYKLSRSPGASASRRFDGHLAEAQELAQAGQYRQTNLDELAGSLLSFVDDNEIFIDQFDRIPPKVLQVLAAAASVRMRDVLAHYLSALDATVGRRNFEYAEIVAKKMKAIFVGSGDSQVKASAIVAVLIAAVDLNRWAAMGVFDELLLSIRKEDDAFAVSEALAENIGRYERVVGRVSRGQLNPALRGIYDKANRQE